MTNDQLNPNDHCPRGALGRIRRWQVEMTLRHCWFRVLLHLRGMVRCPGHMHWHWDHIIHEFYEPNR